MYGKQWFLSKHNLPSLEKAICFIQARIISAPKLPITVEIKDGLHVKDQSSLKAFFTQEGWAVETTTTVNKYGEILYVVTLS